MRFSAKLVCSMLLVVVAFFALGGSALLYGDFTDRLTASARQEQGQHGMTCSAVESEVLSLLRQGDAVDQTALGPFCSRIGGGRDQLRALLPTEQAQAGDALQQSWYSTFPAGWTGTLPGAGQSVVTRWGGRVWRVWRSDLLNGLTLYSAFDLTEVFDARTRSLRRFFLLEGAVLAGAGLVAAVLSHRLTRPLALLSRASRRIAAGDYALRTGIHTGDEIGELSENFDQMAAAVQEKVDALELSVRQREDFMGAFTHELKTPMTGILGYADLLRTMQPDPDEQREAAGAIFHEARRLEDLSGKLLRLLRLDEEGLTLAPMPLDAAVAEAVRAAAPALRRAGGRVLAPATGLWVQGDPDLLCDLLLNLFTNAAKADPGGAVTVAFDPGPDTVGVTVRDRGCGIPADQLDRITEPFYMVDKSRARKQGGSGLGLALCARIAEAHGTALTFASAPGRGTAVRFVLRRARPAAPEKEEPHA